MIFKFETESLEHPATVVVPAGANAMDVYLFATTNVLEVDAPRPSMSCTVESGPNELARTSMIGYTQNGWAPGERRHHMFSFHLKENITAGNGVTIRFSSNEETTNFVALSGTVVFYNVE